MKDFIEHLIEKNPRFVCEPPSSAEGSPEKIFPLTHQRNEGASENDIKVLRSKLTRNHDVLIEFYQHCNGVSLYCHDNSPSIVFFPIDEMDDQNEAFRDWFELEDEEDIFEYQSNGYAFGEVCYSGNFFVFYQGKIYYSSHDGEEEEPIADSFNDFLMRISADPAQFLYDMGCYTRLSDGETNIQWIPKQYLCDD